MKRFFLILTCFSISANLYSQKADTISLKKEFLAIRDLEQSYPDSALSLYKKLLPRCLAISYNQIAGTIYHRLAEVSYAKNKDLGEYFDYNFKGVKKLEACGDSIRAFNIYENIATRLFAEKRFAEALEYHKKVFSFAERNKISLLYVYSGQSIADVYSTLNKDDTSLLILKQLNSNFPNDLPLEERATLLSNISNTYSNIAGKKNSMSDYKTALEYALKSKELYLKDCQDTTNIAFIYSLLGQINLKLNKYKESEKYYQLAIPIEVRYEAYYDLEVLYYEITELYIKMGNMESALTYFSRHDSLTKALFTNRNSESVSRMKTQFETEKKEQENKVLQTENKLTAKNLSQQKIITTFIIVGLILSLVLAFFIFRGLNQQKQANLIISKQKQEAEEQKEIIEEKQKEILDSIRYAKRIQMALLPSNTYIERILNNLK